MLYISLSGSDDPEFRGGNASVSEIVSDDGIPRHFILCDKICGHFEGISELCMPEMTGFLISSKGVEI